MFGSVGLVSAVTMAKTRPGDATASMAILGLLIQQPDTISGVGVRLTETFPTASWSRSIAHNGIPSLKKQGLVRLVEEGAKASLGRYEATPQGADAFRGWLRASLAVPLALLDALQLKLGLAGDEDLPYLALAVKEQEEVSARQSEAAQLRLNQARRKQPSLSRAQSAMMIYEVAVWSQARSRLHRLREALEGEADAGPPGGGDG